MKNWQTNILIVLVVVGVTALAIFLTLKQAPPVVNSTTEQSSTQAVNTGNNQTTIVAIYQSGSATMVLRSGGKGVISGSCFGDKSNFDWQDKGNTIELTNWNWAQAAGGTGVCEKVSGQEAVDVKWVNQGHQEYARLYLVKIE